MEFPNDFQAYKLNTQYTMTCNQYLTYFSCRDSKVIKPFYQCNKKMIRNHSCWVFKVIE